MKLRDSLMLTLKRLSVKKYHMIFSVLGFVIGTASVIAVLCVSDGGKTAIESKLNKMGMDAVAIKTNSVSGVKYTDYEYLSKRLKNAEMTPVYMNYATIEIDGSERDVVIWGVASGFENIYDIHLATGRFFNNTDIQREKNAAVIEGVAAQQLFGGLQTGGNMKLNFYGKNAEIKVVGVVDDSDESLKNTFAEAVPIFIYMPVTTVMKMYGVNNLDYISMKENSTESLGIKGVNLLERRGGIKGTYYLEDMSAQKQSMEYIISLITLVLGAIAAISLIVSAFGVMNIMIMTVSERRAEIGMMKAIGAKKTDILMQFLTESVVITFAGALLGSIIGIACGYAITLWLGIPFVLNSDVIIKTLLTVTAAGLFFGVYPAMMASKLDPVKVLK